MAEVEAFFLLEPWGYHEERRRIALICQTIANAAFGSKGNFKQSDFMPKGLFEDDVDWQNIFTQMRAISTPAENPVEQKREKIKVKK